MNENLTPQIVAALLQDGTVKMTGEEIAAAIADAIGALDKKYRFRCVATPGLAPGKIFEPTLYVAVADATYGPFSNQSVDKGQIVFFISDDGAYWDATIAYCGGNGCEPEPTPPGPTPSAQPLTFRALESGTQVAFLITKGAQDAHDIEQFAKTIEISTDGGQTWTEKTASLAGTLLATLQAGDELQVRGNNTAYANILDIDSAHYHNFAATKSCEAFGNIMSLIDAENYEEKQLDPAYNSFAFYGLFMGATWLHNADDAPLRLPSKTLAAGCYSGMFGNCTSLTAAPALPATTLAVGCYEGMFGNCTSLTAAPALPATTLAVSCYEGMFGNCTSLTAAPALPATTLAELCYNGMFYGCTLLAAVECLATDLSAAALNALDDWLYGVAETGTFTKAAGVNWPTGESGIPTGWTVVEA